MSQHLEAMRLLQRIADEVNSSLALEGTLQAILDAIQEGLSAQAVIVRLLNPSADGLEIVASTGVPPDALAGLSVLLAPGSVNERVILGETVRAAAGELDPRLDGALPEGLRDAAMLAAPLSIRGRQTGSLTVFCREGCGFDETALNVVQAAAGLSAIAIEKARLHMSLMRIAGALASTLELQPLLDRVLAAVVLEMGLKAASVRLLDKDGRRLVLAAARGLSDRYLEKGGVEVSRSKIDQRLLAGETVVLYDVSGEPGFQYPSEAASEGIRSVLAVPLSVKDRVIGVMRVYSAQPRQFTTIGVGFLQSVAGLVGLAVENARLHQALQERYDELKVDVGEWYRFLSLG
jgi:GAF domain-containing protein